MFKVGDQFKAGQDIMQVNRIQELDGKVKETCLQTGKDPVWYFCGKVLKNGKVSKKQGGVFYRFSSGRTTSIM